ncbi:PREDICTED: rhotekin-2, partial [Fulmarus glacialis]|uniref:rhotekin-2 n=1 Tax=Fulmarus glacialis TaxID=30455 RepID=UPI00051B39FC
MRGDYLVSFHLPLVTAIKGHFLMTKAANDRECDIQEKINFEIRMREGICKLLAVSTQKDQLLQAVKNLMVCNARILAYRTELQNQKEELDLCRTEERSSDNGTKDRVACRAKVAISVAKASSSGTDRIGSGGLQHGAQWGFPNWGDLRGSRESRQEPPACVTAADETWAGPGGMSAMPAHP